MQQQTPVHSAVLMVQCNTHLMERMKNEANTYKSPVQHIIAKKTNTICGEIPYERESYTSSSFYKQMPCSPPHPRCHMFHHCESVLQIGTSSHLSCSAAGINRLFLCLLRRHLDRFQIYTCCHLLLVSESVRSKLQVTLLLYLNKNSNRIVILFE